MEHVARQKREQATHEKTEILRHNLKVLLSGYGNVSKAAAAAGITREYLSMVIHGDHMLNIDACFRLADHFEMTIDQLTAERFEGKPVAAAP